MCRWISVKATTLDGEPHPHCPEEIEFEVPDSFSTDYPTCTCEIGDKEGDGKILRHTFVDTVLQPFLEKVAVGKIIILIE